MRNYYGKTTDTGRGVVLKKRCGNAVPSHAKNSFSSRNPLKQAVIYSATRALTNATPKIPRTVPKNPKSVVVQHKIGVP